MAAIDLTPKSATTLANLCLAIWWPSVISPPEESREEPYNQVEKNGQTFHENLVQLTSQPGIEKELDIGVRRFALPQTGPNLPVPIGKRTIPDTETKA